MRARPTLLGLDPGFASFGWTVLELGASAADDRVLRCGVIHTEKSAKKRSVRASDDNLRRTREIIRVVCDLFDGHEPVALAAESFSPPRNASNAAKVAFAWGAIAAIADHQRDTPILQCSPQELKVAVTDTKTASKKEIEDALARRYPEAKGFVDGFPDGDHEHLWDAIGAAHACLDTEVVRLARRMR